MVPHIGPTGEGDELAPDNPGGMARSTSRQIRMPDALWDRVTRHASAEGISAAEFVRQALVFRMAWSAAGRAVQSGFPPERINDLDSHSRALLTAARLLDEEP